MKSTERQPGLLFQSLHRARSAAVLAGLHEHGLQDLGSPMILFVLKHLGHGGEVAAQREIADEMKVSPASVAVSLKSLARGGYVEKRADEGDGRRKRIAITPKGEEALKTCMKIFKEVDARMFSSFSRAERDQMIVLFRQMLKNLQVPLSCEKKGCILHREGSDCSV